MKNFIAFAALSIAVTACTTVTNETTTECSADSTAVVSTDTTTVSDSSVVDSTITQ